MNNKIILLFFFIVFIIGCSNENVDFEVSEEINDGIKEYVKGEGEAQQGYIDEQDVIEEETDKENMVCLYFFHNNMGSPCLEEKSFLFKMQKKYPNLMVKEFITNTKKNVQLMYDLAEKHNFNVKFVPITFIGDNVIKGYYDDSTTGNEIEEIIKQCVDCRCPSID